MAPSSAGFTGSILPEIGFTVVAPEPLLNSSRFMRAHNRAMKEVLKAVLYLWHAKILPEHFKSTARAKYGHRPRQESTRHRKMARRHHDVDNVNSGKTSRSMKSKIPRAVTSGNAKTMITARMRYRFPFPVSRDVENPSHVSMKQMAAEIATWTKAEQQWAIDTIAKLYSRQIEYELRNSPRVLRKYRTKKYTTT